MKKRSSAAMLITFILMLSLWCMGSASASAAKSSAPVCAKKQTIKIVKVEDGEPTDSVIDGGYICIKNLKSDAKIYSIKSSNKRIGAESMLKEHGFNAIHVFPKNVNVKDGAKSTITFKVKQNKKTYTLKCTVTFKYASPFKKLTVGNKKCTGALRVQTVNRPDINGLDVQAAPGYKITMIELQGRSITIDEDGYPVPSSWARIFRGNEQINSLKNRDLSEVKRIVIYYEATKKPAYYKNPKHWNGDSDSPLSGYKEISFI